MNSKQAILILWEALQVARENLPDDSFLDSEWESVCEALDNLAAWTGHSGTLELLGE
jgi:hypothetical protein